MTTPCDAASTRLRLAAPPEPPPATRPPPVRGWLLVHLRGRLASLERQIGAELARPRPDLHRLHALRQERLSVKDRLAAVIRTGGAPAPRHA